jgi:hypothetical protein
MHKEVHSKKRFWPKALWQGLIARILLKFPSKKPHKPNWEYMEIFAHIQASQKNTSLQLVSNNSHEVEKGWCICSESRVFTTCKEWTCQNKWEHWVATSSGFVITLLIMAIMKNINLWVFMTKGILHLPH